MRVFSGCEIVGTRSGLAPHLLGEMWEELLTKYGTCWGTVISNSMHPMIRLGDQVLVERVRPGTARFGDIVVFRRNGMLIVHRMLGKRASGGKFCFLEKGDASLQAGVVPSEDIIGRVIVIRNSHQAIQTAHGSGRLLQLTLACISYFSLRQWISLEYCLALGRNVAFKNRGEAAYNRFYSVLRRITLQLFL